MSSSLYSSMSIAELFMEKQRVTADAAVYKEFLSAIQAELNSRYQERVKNNLKQQGKDFGLTTIEDDSFKVKANVRKRVEWDKDKLCKILNEMDAETAKHYAEVRYTVSEAKYNNAPPEIKEKLKDCRTVFLQGTSFDIEEIE